MDQQIISLTDKAQVVERAPEQLSNKVVEELIGLVQRIENQEEANNESKATYWVYRVPFAGVRYYSYQ
jgi:predicted transcriptional regulator